MRRLSTLRRHPLAGLVVLVAALALTGGLYAAFSPGSASAADDDTDQIEAGRELFLIGCASCHGMNGEGIETKEGNNYGPSLVGVGAAAVDFQVGTGRMPMALSGPQAPEKEPVYTDEEISQLSAYVASLGPGPDIPDERYLDWQNASDEQIGRGGEFFRTNCTACHNSVGAGGALPDGRYAPSLQDVDPKHIYEAMLTGPQQMPKFSDAVMTPQDKADIIAFIKTVDEKGAIGGYGAGSIGPVSDGFIAWVVGIGGLIGFAIWIGAHGARVKKQQ